MDAAWGTLASAMDSPTVSVEHMARGYNGISGDTIVRAMRATSGPHLAIAAEQTTRYHRKIEASSMAKTQTFSMATNGRRRRIGASVTTASSTLEAQAHGN